MSDKPVESETQLSPCPLSHYVSAGLRVSTRDPRIVCLDCGLTLCATDWVTLYERWQARVPSSEYLRELPTDASTQQAAQMVAGHMSIGEGTLGGMLVKQLAQALSEAQKQGLLEAEEITDNKAEEYEHLGDYGVNQNYVQRVIAANEISGAIRSRISQNKKLDQDQKSVNHEKLGRV